MKTSNFFKFLLLVCLLLLPNMLFAQFKYDKGRIVFGNIEPKSFYTWTLKTTGIYLTSQDYNFLQLDITPAAPRIAGHGDQIVFYNTETNKFNSIQVDRVYNYSDARAKKNIHTISNGLDLISALRPVSYSFSSGVRTRSANSTNNKFIGDNTDLGLLAQEVEKVLPNLVFTDPEGRKLVDYTAIIPLLIDAVKSLKKEVATLKLQLEKQK